MSSIKKGEKFKDDMDDDGYVIVSGDQSNLISSHQSPQVRQRVNNAIKKLQASPSPKQAPRVNLKEQATSNRAKIENKRNIVKTSLNDLSATKQHFTSVR